MKTRLLIIVVVAVMVGLTSITTSVLYFSDFTKYNDENIYGISAKVIRSARPLPINCPIGDCQTTHFQLAVESKSPAVIEEYKICNGLSCIKEDGMRHNTNELQSALIPLFGVESWEIGDMVSIKVGASTLYDETYTHPFPITHFIDLGQSVIGGTK